MSAWLATVRDTSPRPPFFAFVHLFDCHADYTPEPPFDTSFDPGYHGPVTGAVGAGSGVRPDMDPRDLAHLVALYDGAIRSADTHLGRLIGDLRARGTLDDTIVVVTSDHGEEFFEHGVQGHEHNLYDAAVRVPLVIRFPRAVPAGTVLSRTVRLMDVPATALALAGVSCAGFGRPRGGAAEVCVDLSPLLRDGSGRDGPGLLAFGDLHGTLSSLRTDRFKLVRHGSGPVGEELYDLRADPGERHSVASGIPEVRSEMERALSQWRGLWRCEGAPAPTFVPDAEHVKRLRALGYM